MVKAPFGYLRKPTAPAFVAPQLVLDVLAATEAALGLRARLAVMAAAEIARMPGPTEPVPEAKAHRLHQTLRRLHPAEAADILHTAGQATGGDRPHLPLTGHDLPRRLLRHRAGQGVVVGLGPEEVGRAAGQHIEEKALRKVQAREGETK